MFLKPLLRRPSSLRCVRTLTASRKTPLFVTTPIFYVNAAPHIGHLYSAVIADAVFRFERLLGQHPDDRLITGTDEHGSKIQQAAAQHNVTPAQYCDRISGEYRELFARAHIANTDFIRTTEDRHKEAVAAFWNILSANNTIYKKQYSGWYCVPDETFLTETQLKENAAGQKVSAESGHPVEWTEEQNYMFRLSQFQDDVVHWIKSGDRIKPSKFEKILLDSLQEPLPDVSVSRPSSRVHWAIPVPGDASQSVYVWLDALVNYLTCAGFPNRTSGWPATLQVIGKDILKFHGIYWPAFLIAAGLEPPQRLLVHSHWTVDGEKMSKSKGNVVDPTQRSGTYTFDGMRYFLLREGTAHSDGNYSDVKLMRILNSELADTLGNLLSRGCAKTVNTRQVFPALNRRVFDKELMQLDVTRKLVNLIEQLPDKCHAHYKAYNFYLAVDQIIEVLHTANNLFETTKPWMLAKTEETQKLETVLCVTLETLRICGIILQPIVPQLSAHLLDKLRVRTDRRMWCDAMRTEWTTYERGLCAETSAILFQRIRLEKDEAKGRVKNVRQ